MAIFNSYAKVPEGNQIFNGCSQEWRPTLLLRSDLNQVSLMQTLDLAAMCASHEVVERFIPPADWASQWYRYTGYPQKKYMDHL